MARPGITRDDVANAVLQLKEAHYPVTTTNVHRELGRGSLSTVQRHLEALGAKERGIRNQATEPLPVEMQVLAESFMSRLWSAFTNQANERVAAATHPYRLRIRELRRERDVAREQRRRAEYELVQVRAEFAAAQTQVARLRNELRFASYETPSGVSAASRPDETHTESRSNTLTVRA